MNFILDLPQDISGIVRTGRNDFNLRPHHLIFINLCNVIDDFTGSILLGCDQNVGDTGSLEPIQNMRNHGLIGNWEQSFWDRVVFRQRVHTLGIRLVLKRRPNIDLPLPVPCQNDGLKFHRHDFHKIG